MTSSISGTRSSMSATMLKQMQEEMFKKADKNGDGKISADEMSQMAKAGNSQSSSSSDNMFSQLDTDGDGAISRLESDASIAKMSQQMKGMGAPPPPPPLDDTSSSDSTSSDSSSSSTITSLLKTLSTALQSGNTTDANTALTSLEKLASSNSNSNSNSSSSDNPFLKDLQSIGSALSSGDTTGAQSILASVQEKIQNHGAPPPPPDNTSSASLSSTSSPSSASEIDSLLKTLESSTSNKDLLNVITSAIKSYMQQSSSSYSQSSSSSVSQVS
ncbi:MAG: EF-hand domain-containing protein [Desulfuromonadales bacterium]|nr:EF-hand domain-containing protein [Desulfuromonadales bacterium]